MKELTHVNFQSILKAIEILNADIEPETLPKRLMNSVNYLIPSDITAFEMVAPDGQYQGCLIYEPNEAISASEMDVYTQYLGEHPFFEAIILARRYDAITISDFVPDQKFTRTGIYNEYYRRVGVNRQISVTMNVTDDCLILGTLSRGGSDFGDTERAMLNLMSPHYTAAVRNSNLLEQLQNKEKNWQAIAEALGQSVIILDGEISAIKYISPQAESFLAKYFKDEKVSVNNLPNSLYRWVTKRCEDADASQNYYFPAEPLVLSADGEKLTIQFSRNQSLNLINLLLKEDTAFLPEDLLSLGLTKRETDVLYWIVGGKTNAEIGFLCGISSRTVHKHTEKIFAKLGVENRTAAAMRASEAIN